MSRSRDDGLGLASVGLTNLVLHTARMMAVKALCFVEAKTCTLKVSRQGGRTCSAMLLSAIVTCVLTKHVNITATDT